MRAVKRPQFRIELDKVFEWDDEHQAYLFAGVLRGRSLARWKKDRKEREYCEALEKVRWY